MSFATNTASESRTTFDNKADAQKEFSVRAWLANKESVCPYAPGLAKFVHLPKMTSMTMDHVYYLAKELSSFYQAKENGKRVGRWMLLPHEEWQTHEEAHHESEKIFWLLNAAYFHLQNDKKAVKAAMKKQLDGFPRGYKGEILNPIVGKLPDPKAKSIPAKSLFYSALSPLYNSKQFYRYCPHSIMPLVYASEFQELKEKHTKVTETVCFNMAHGGLFEVFGDDLDLDLLAFRQELPFWGSIIDCVAEHMRAAKKGVPYNSKAAKGTPGANLNYFRVCHPKMVISLFNRHLDRLNVLRKLIQQTQAHPKQIINASFAGSGLYTIPEY